MGAAPGALPHRCVLAVGISEGRLRCVVHETVARTYCVLQLSDRHPLSIEFCYLAIFGLNWLAHNVTNPVAQFMCPYSCTMTNVLSQQHCPSLVHSFTRQGLSDCSFDKSTHLISLASELDKWIGNCFEKLS